MSTRLVSVTMIIFLLVAQAGEAFAVSSVSCFNNEHNLIITDAAADVGGSNVEHDMGAEMHANNDILGNAIANNKMMEHECCQQECDCPVGMFSLAVLIEFNIQVTHHLSDEQKVDVDRRLVHAFIPSQKRPPKYEFALTA